MLEEPDMHEGREIHLDSNDDEIAVGDQVIYGVPNMDDPAEVARSTAKIVRFTDWDVDDSDDERPYAVAPKAVVEFEDGDQDEVYGAPTSLTEYHEGRWQESVELRYDDLVKTGQGQAKPN